MSHLLPSRALALEKGAPGDWSELDAGDRPPGAGRTAERIATVGRFRARGCWTFAPSAVRGGLARAVSGSLGQPLRLVRQILQRVVVPEFPFHAPIGRASLRRFICS